ncbi:hypothetical protein E2C01_035617 [Portunus trituberculatus]|uniref:Uncharacterized protein n=1 Tax=Portunus trituberculatus TaxID=210409 RepID=A0A5B7F8U8_PORTR|nr:hypothetical protein [Portunus trituberculatus]
MSQRSLVDRRNLHVVIGVETPPGVCSALRVGVEEEEEEDEGSHRGCHRVSVMWAPDGSGLLASSRNTTLRVSLLFGLKED